MALNFPNNPSVNDTVELAGKTYQYDGVKWRMVYVVTPTLPTAQALAPTITEVSTTDSSITFTITNNDASTAVILYEVGDTTPDANSIELAAAATSSNIEVTGLAVGTAFDVYATANVTGKIKSNVTELEISTDNIIYTAATGGTTQEYDSGGKRFKSHTFTTNGTFEVTTVGDATDDRNKVDYLIIAGAGGGGGRRTTSDRFGGGGGAGGYRTTNGTSGENSSAESKIVVTATTFAVVIGAGGGGGASTASDSVDVSGNNGVASSALGITSTGGGGGGGGVRNATFINGKNGGSGGGAGKGFSDASTFGTGTSNQGFDGGNRAHPGDAGGGGGAGSVGQIFSGGNGLANNLRTGSNETRGGGGNGAAGSTSASANTGSGGQGAFDGAGGNGGSGLVIIRYEIAPSV